MDEIALIQAARGGDLDSFNRLVLAYQDQIYSQAYRMIGDSESADDATQNAFISAYNHLNSFRGGSFKAWLLRIVTNACYDELRRRKRRPTVPLEPLDDAGEEVESAHWMVDPADQPEDQVQRIELQRAIQHCLVNRYDIIRAEYSRIWQDGHAGEAETVAYRGHVRRQADIHHLIRLKSG